MSFFKLNLRSKLGYINLMRKYVIILLILVSIAALMGCGGGPKYVRPDYSSFVWPGSPNPPKIKLLNVVMTDLDFRKRTAAEKMFGEEAFFYFKKPHDVAVDMNNNVLVSDTYRNKVFVLNFDKGAVGELFNPYGWGEVGGVATDNVNGLIGATSGNKVVILDQKSKKVLFTIGPGMDFVRPMGIAFDPVRKIIYVAATRKHELHSFDYQGNHLKQIAYRGTEPGDVYFPTDLAVDSEGRLYVVDTMNWRIDIFGPDGKYLRSFGTNGDTPGTFARPKGIAISNDGFVFVTDAAFGNFQVFDEKGQTYTYVGVPGTGFGMFNQPTGIAIGDDDKIYVVDQTNRRLQIFQYLSPRYLKEHPEEAKAGTNVTKSQ